MTVALTTRLREAIERLVHSSEDEAALSTLADALIQVARDASIDAASVIFLMSVVAMCLNHVRFLRAAAAKEPAHG